VRSSIRITFFLLSTVCVFILPLTANAQESSSLRVGARVRVFGTHNKTSKGFITRLDQDSMTYSGSKGEWTVARSEVSRVQVGKLNRPLGAVKYSLIGLGMGAMAGAIIGGATYDGSCDFIVCSAASQAALAGIITGVFGFGVGILGGAIAGQEQWRDVPRTTTR
jgi:hypothetical protein